MPYTVRETERDVCKLRLKTDIGTLSFTYVDSLNKWTLCLKKFEISRIVQNHTTIKEIWKTPGSADERERGIWYKLPGPGDPERGPAPR